MTVSDFLLALIAIFAAAKIFGEIAERVGQPAVLGEMIGGIVIGVSGLHLVDAHSPLLQILSEVGVILLLFLIGLETDVRRLLSVGGASATVAFVGVALPLLGGIAAGRALGMPPVVSLLLGAALTATSVGITARVLADLGHLKSDEAQVILGAAVIDDVLGLICLAIVAGLAAGQTLTTWSVAKMFIAAFGFIALALVIGSVLAPRVMALITRLRVAKGLFFASVMFAFALAWTADFIGSAMIIGAFAAGLILARTGRGADIEHEVHDVAQFFIPIFFVLVGAAVDLETLNPFEPQARRFFIIGVVLTLIAIVGKVAAGYASFGRPLRRLVIGVGMVPRGEVGLIFAQLGLSTGLLTAGLYSSVAMMVIVTTLIAPPALRALLKPVVDEKRSTVSELITESLADASDRRQDERRAG
ncbi:MAG TPA: cation:proton antiporter [Thermoanaerobaculia bacterium]|nr:cation:proton antiporter [Thermoanaerobaculia bacterium]